MKPEVTGARILAVDDEPGMLRALSRVLDRHHEVLCADSAESALEQCAAFVPDIAIIDIYMPGMSGFELMQLLHAQRPDLDVIIMTGSAGQPNAHLVRAIDDGAFYFIRKPFDRRVLQTLVARCIELRRLQRDKQRYVRRLERELADARVFQRSLLPPDDAVVQGAALSARYIACDELAGDFYDYAAAGEDSIALIVADVAGHGAGAAMLTGIVKSAFHATRVDGYDPLVVVQRVVESMRPISAQRFVTLICCLIDRARETITYVNAGHPPGILRRNEGALELLESTGPLVSSGFTGIDWEANHLPFASSDRLLLYTDGVMEVRGSDGMFGYRRIVSHFERSDQHGGPLLDDILRAIGEFSEKRPYTDDMTLLTVS